MIERNDFETEKQVDVIIPVKLTDVDLKGCIKSVIDLHKKAGFSKFILSGPSKGWRCIGYPQKDCFEQIADQILEFKKGVQDYDIQLGWWNLLTLKSGKFPSQRVINLDGGVSEMSSCPLDPDFQERFASDVALVAQKAKPFMIIFEDDYGLFCQNRSSCFCNLHLQEFAKRIGKYYSREELQKKITVNTKEAVALRLQWGELCRDSLASFAACVRKEVDKKTPWMPMGSMQSGGSDNDGDCTKAVAEAFAGKNQKPFVRLYGTSYSSDDVSNMPQNIFHALYSKQHLPENFTLYHESDTFPHTRFFMSAGKMKSLMATAYSYAFDGSTFQVRQNLDVPNEEKGYYEMFMLERKRFNAIQEIAKKCVVSGCGMIYDPLGFWRNVDNNNWSNDWVRAFAHFGIPYTTKEAQVNVISGTVPNALSDKQIKTLLTKGLLLDAEAAKIFCDRGFGDDIGVMVQSQYDSSVTKDISRHEKIRDKFVHGNTGKLMAGCFGYSPFGNGKLFQLKPLNSSCEIITDLQTFRRENFGVGMTRYENSRGGRVVVMAMTVKNNMSSSLFNYRRQRLLQELVVWLGAKDIVYVKEQAKIFCVFNRPLEKFKKDFLGVVTLINLCPDNFEFVELCIPEEWGENCGVKYLDANGIWQNASYKYADSNIKIYHSVSVCEPLYLRFYRYDLRLARHEIM